MDGLLRTPQILVAFIDPIGAGRGEDIEIDCVFNRLGLMGHVGRNAEHFAGMHDDLFSVDPEFQSAIEDVSELLVVVAVLGNDAAFFEQHARQHNFLANDELPMQERFQFFERDSVPRDILQRGLKGRMFADGALRSRVGLRILLLFSGFFLASRFLSS